MNNHLREAPGPRQGPNWQSAATEAEAARRQLAQASASLDRLAAEIKCLREQAACVAHLELARQLLSGEDGGPLALLASLAAGGGSPSTPPSRIAVLILERLRAALHLTPTHEIGDRVRPSLRQLAEFELLGAVPDEEGGDREYVVVRPGWRMGETLVARPVLALTEERENRL